ncbi:MAG: S9 family peptidase [Candidatus Zixiibacteriota bacterium]|nr:MAG: S9 family peptidase [candidate division Zixibacteria bacterium]
MNRNTLVGRALLPALMVLMAATMLGVSPAARADVFTPEHLARLRYISEATVSPDGKTVAYTLVVPRNPMAEDDGSAWRELHVTDLSGRSRPFVTGKVRVSAIEWTPDGKLISYLAERNEDTVKNFYVIPADGGESRKIYGGDAGIKEYSWAPDSRRVAVVAKDCLPDAICELRKKGFDQEVYEEDWRHNKVWLYDISTPEVAAQALDLPGTAGSISWSPDGKRLAMTIVATPLIDDWYMYRDVAVVDIASQKVEHTFDMPGKLGGLSWSPDGARLAIIAGADINDPSAGELLVADIKGKTLKPVIADFDGHVRDVAWLDNKTILYRASEHVWATAGKVDINSLEREVLLGPGQPILERMRLSRDGQTVAFVASTPKHDSEAFVWKVGKGKPVRLTDSNPWLNDIQLAEQEVIEFTARDGLKLEGILIRPLNQEAGRTCPLILSVHGGPESNHVNGWLTWYSAPGQIAAARGFAVFYPNYRGSTGRGVEFSKMGQADYAGGEFNDLVDAVEHLVSTGLVDRERVGVTGRSYGGYATAWASTALSEHFAAGVMGVGVSDLISKFGTTDIPREMYLVHARRWPWDHWQWYAERSPIYHAQKHRTPLLILVGEDDTRVHPSQSMEMYRYLKTLDNAPVRLVFYQDEGHGTGKAAARYDANLRMLRWLEHYLTGPGNEPPPYQLDYSGLKTDAGTE